MREHEVVVASEVEVAGTLCLPEGATAAGPAPAMLLIGGTGADTRDGDLDLPRPRGDEPAAPGTLRRIAHHLAGHGVATLRCDRRGFGRSGGDRGENDYRTDVVDAVAAWRWLAARPEVDRRRVAVAGHSAGALVASRVCRDVPEVAAAALLGGLASPIADFLRQSVGRLARHWPRFTPEQQARLLREAPAALVRSEGVEALLAGAGAGQERVRLEGHGVVVDAPTARLRQDLATDYAAELGHVRCPALVLHGGDDLNVDVENALIAYRSLRAAGNDHVQLCVLPGLEHYFCPVSPDPGVRVFERATYDALRRPMAVLALDTLAGWARRTLW